MAVSIIKNGQSITIAGYNQATTSGSITIGNFTNARVTQSGNFVNLDIKNATSTFKFHQITGGTNAVESINGTNTTAFSATQLKAAFDLLISSGNGSGLVIQSATIMQITTSATGANFVAFADMPCVALDLVNFTGTALEYKRNGVGSTMFVGDFSGRMIEGITNANQISLRRINVSNVQVTTSAEAIVA